MGAQVLEGSTNAEGRLNTGALLEALGTGSNDGDGTGGTGGTVQRESMLALDVSAAISQAASNVSRRQAHHELFGAQQQVSAADDDDGPGLPSQLYTLWGVRRSVHP